MIPAPAETARLAQRHSLVVGYRLQHRTGAAFRIPDRASLSPSAVSTVTANLSSRRSRSAPFLAKYRLGIYANAAPRADSSHPLSAPVLYRHWSFIDTGLSLSPKPFRRIERQSPTTPCVFTTELGQPCDPRNALRALKAAAKKPGCLQRSGCTPRGALACLSHVVGWRAAQGGLGDLQFAQASRSLEAFMVTSRPMCLVRR